MTADQGFPVETATGRERLAYIVELEKRNAALLAERDDLAIRADERRIMCDEKDATIKRQTRRVQGFREAVWEHLIRPGDDGVTASGYGPSDIPDELLYDAIVDESGRVAVLEAALRDAKGRLEFVGDWDAADAVGAVLAGGDAAAEEKPCSRCAELERELADRDARIANLREVLRG